MTSTETRTGRGTNSGTATGAHTEERWVIYQPYNEHGGGFVIGLVAGRRVHAELTATKMEVLKAYNRGYLADEKLPAELRGWRGPEQITRGLGYRMEHASLRRTVARINREFRQAVAQSTPGVTAPPLLTTKRQIGTRVTRPFEVVVPKA